ncbi:MAG: YggS family pyridoxal phosphate-dependent enzyme [Gammaproteobacteria bacterium]|jgi:pyridoxal phosphate enzyme (YggS family)|nr:YggS family pyridoxal phosphate-dependent enzyme [Gammaproteobacteria bacterium]
MSEPFDRLQAVRARIATAAAAAGRAEDSVRLLAVGKTRPPEDLAALRALGQRAFGENYVQEAEAKMAALAGLDLEWHYIGRVQTNKTRPIAERFHWVHGLADLHHARRLNEQRPPDLPPLHVCIQVNVSGERSKGGVSPEAVAELARAVSALPRLRLRGLMTIPAPAATPEAQRAPYRALRELRDRLGAGGLELDTLSMGMSDDLEAAIVEGATLVRVGTALFGPRPAGAGARLG